MLTFICMRRRLEFINSVEYILYYLLSMLLLCGIPKCYMHLLCLFSLFDEVYLCSNLDFYSEFKLTVNYVQVFEISTLF